MESDLGGFDEVNNPGEVEKSFEISEEAKRKFGEQALEANELDKIADKIEQTVEEGKVHEANEMLIEGSEQAQGAAER